MLSREEELGLAFDLINSFKIIKTSDEVVQFIQDLFTAKEIKNLSRRLRIAKLIIKGETQEEIVRKLNCSFATVTKVSAWLNRGEGLKNVIGKLPPKYKMPKKLPPRPIEFHLPEFLVAATQYTLAPNQDKKLKKFTNSVKDKKDLDKELSKISDESFRNKHRLKIIKSLPKHYSTT